MKILQVINAFYPCRIWGGPPQNTYLLSKALIDLGHDVQILTTNILDHNSRMSKKTFQGDWNGIPVTYMNTYWLGKRSNSVGFILVPDMLFYRSVIQDADIVHVHGYRHYMFTVSTLLAIRSRVPFVFQARGAMGRRFGRTGLKGVYDTVIGKYIAKHTASAIALSEDEITDYQCLNVRPERIFKINNPIDFVRNISDAGKLAFRQDWGISPEEKVILFLSRLHERKGLDLLIIALAKLNKQNVRLVVVGPDDGFLEIARKMVDELGLGRKVIFTGPLYDDAKSHAYQASDVYVFPTQGGEGFPTTVLEACVNGTPTVITNKTEAAELVADCFGLVVNYDADELSYAISRILCDKELADKFKEGARAIRLDEYSPSFVAKQHENVYNSILRYG